VSPALRLATRGSPLALAQTQSVIERLAAWGVTAAPVVVETEGDRRHDVALAELAGRGVFTKEIQAAVLDGRADAAVHSAKDLPPRTPDGLVLAAVPERGDPADALVGAPLAVLPPGATVATGAPRRRALLLAERPDLSVVSLRGNIAARLAVLEDQGVDAVVIAVAALARLGLDDRVAERLDPDRFVPQVGQGAIAIECAAGADALEPLAAIDDTAARLAVACERAFLDELGVGCDLPGGAHATWSSGRVVVHGVLMTEDGAVVVRDTEADGDGDRAGRALAARLRDALGHEVAAR
jgi:hydroxymethylbilane synthase